MIKAIIFDCFGVLAQDGWLPYRKRYFKTPNEFSVASELSNQSDAGTLAYPDFINTVADMAKIAPQEASRLIEDNPADDQLLEYISKTLKPNYKIGMLSNVGGNRLSELFTEGQLSVFDAFSLSFETGFVKPDERAYLDIAKRLAVEPEDCIFVDDQERYCTTAQDLGMKTIHYIGFEQFKVDIEQILSQL